MFAGCRLDGKLPDHSSLTRIRQRWGDELFRCIFQRIVHTCIEAGLVGGDPVHVDATPIRADVSWDSLAADHAAKAIAENADDSPNDPRSEAASIPTRR